MELTLRSAQVLKQEAEDIGFEGKDILEYVKEQQKLDREERAAWRNIRMAKLQAEDKKRADESHIKIQIAQIEAAKEQAKIEAAKEQAKIEAEKELALKELELKAQQNQASACLAATPPPRNKDAKSPKLPSFIDEKDELDSYLLHFERYAENASWKKDTWAIKLSALLTGRAMDVYTRMSDADASDYDKLKKALLTRYNYTEDGYRKGFREATTRYKRNSKKSGTEGSTNSDRAVYSAVWCAQSNDGQTYMGVGKLNGRPVKVLRDTGCTGMIVDRALVPDVMVIPGSSGSLQMVDHTLIDVLLANVYLDSPYYKGHCRVMCVSPPVYPVIIGNVRGAQRMLPDPDWKAEDQPGVRARTSGGNKDKDNDDNQGGDLPAWMFKRSNQKTEKSAPKERNSKKKPAQPKENDDRARRNVKVKEGATQEKCVAGPVVTRAQAKKSDKVHPLKVKEAMSSVDKLTIENLQKKDSTLKKCFDRIGKPIIRENYVGEFYKKNGLLYRKHQETKTGRSCNQLVVPKELRRQVMSVNHESAFSGHLGAKKTEVRILPNFFWPGLCQDVIRFCRSCDVCQRTVKRGSVKKVPLGSMPLINTPFKRVAVDIVGPIAPPE